VFKNVPIPPDLLKIVNSTTSISADDLSSGDLDLAYPILVWTGVATLVSLIGILLYKVALADDLKEEMKNTIARIARAFHSTLILRLCLLQMLLVIPLIFYVHTKEHYWTSKHTTMLFMTCLGLASWLVIRHQVPRFRCPYTWPIALVIFGGTFSMFCAVNIAEGMGDLFAIFGSAALTFLATQAFSTSKRIHLMGLVFALVAVVMSMYGLAQAYLLAPMDYVYALDTRAPVSTIGNKNYAAYFLDLAIPLTVALAVSRRNPLQTIFALIVYFICRWHFVLCDTRGGTISMTVGILLTTLVVALYHGRRFRLFLYLILLEPLLWGAINAADIHYADTQKWGSMVNRGPERMEIAKAASKVWSSAPEELRNAINANHLVQWFIKGNEYLLGVQWRIPALVFGLLLALGVFWWLVTHIKDWRIHLGSAAVLAFLPYWFVMWGTFPQKLDATTGNVSIIVEGIQQSGIMYKEIASQIMEQYAGQILPAAVGYNQLILGMHQTVAAMFAFSLFVCMATFLLFRWFDRDDGWLPGFAIVGSIGIWYLVYFILGADGNPVRHLLTCLFQPLSHAWPIELKHVTEHHQLVGLFLSGLAFGLVSLISLFACVVIMQFIPAAFPEEEARRLNTQAVTVGKWAGAALILMLILGVWFHPRIVRVRGEIYSTMDQGLVRAIFYGAHAFFNTQGQVKGEDMDGPVGFRLEIYQGTLRKMRDNPILGVGPGNFKVINPHPKYETALERRILGKEVLGRHPHNDFLEDATDSGSLALLGMIWLFGVAGVILFRSLRFIHEPRDGTDVFMNVITWGLVWAMTAIVMHAQFEMPLLQPSSTYPAWMLLGVCYQLWRIQRRRALAVSTQSSLLLSSDNPAAVAERVLHGEPLRSAAVYELPPVRPCRLGPLSSFPISVSWPVLALVVTLLVGSTLIRQFAGEMWLRWGMLFSESGMERYDYVFACMEKSEDVYPLEMETNYILGRYCIDATALVFRPWHIKNRPDIYNEAERKQNEEDIAEIRKTYQLDVDKLVDYAKLGIDVHKRDIYMNPNYKWAHNNMGVLYDKLNQIYSDLSETSQDPTEQAKYARLAFEAEQNSRNCYSIALEVDDLQVYALYNLGHGAMRDQKLDLAQKYFGRTLLADPRRQDVNFFIAQCRLKKQDLPGALESFQNLFAWSDENKRLQEQGEKARRKRENRENEKWNFKPKEIIEEYQRKETENLLLEMARFSLSEGDPKVGYGAADLLTKQYNRCRYLPLLAHGAADLGNATEALSLANTAMTECGPRVSSEVVFAQAKANCLLKEATAALTSLQTLMRSGAGDVFRDEIKKDAVFDLIRGLPAFNTVVNEKVVPKAVPKPKAPAVVGPASQTAPAAPPVQPQPAASVPPSASGPPLAPGQEPGGATPGAP
jgi:O-antigen ligase